MADHTAIEWTDATWNPIGGCSIRSPGCINCYAQSLAGTRLKTHPVYAGTTDVVKGKPVFNGRLTAAANDHPIWGFPLSWRGAKTPKLGPGRPSMIFVGDMSDLLHEDRSLGYFMRVVDIAARSRHIVQILTKRADRLAEAIAMWSDVAGEDYAFHGARGPAATRQAHPSRRAELFALMLETMGDPPDGCAFPTFDWMGGPLYWPDVLRNVWLGFSAERQKEFDERWQHMKTVAARGWTIFVSIEPALGPVVLPPDFLALGSRAMVIWGGESGPDARPAHPHWARSLRDQCVPAGVAFFFKQWGEWAPHAPVAGGDLGSEIRAGKVRIVHPSGRSDVDVFNASGGARSTEHGSRYMVRVGRKAAGALLDGREWRQFPEAAT